MKDSTLKAQEILSLIEMVKQEPLDMERMSKIQVFVNAAGRMECGVPVIQGTVEEEDTTKDAGLPEDQPAETLEPLVLPVRAPTQEPSAPNPEAEVMSREKFIFGDAAVPDASQNLSLLAENANTLLHAVEGQDPPSTDSILPESKFKQNSKTGIPLFQGNLSMK